MKKSLTKLLARMAKDGDVETVAEFIEEMIGEEAETPAEEVAEVVEAVAETAEEAPGALCLPLPAFCDIVAGRKHDLSPAYQR